MCAARRAGAAHIPGAARPVCALLLALLSGPAAAQSVRVQATLAQPSVAAGETAQLDVTVRTDGDEPESWSVPPLPGGVAVIGSSEQTEVAFSLPGGRSFTMTRTYFLSTSRPGRYRLPSITVEVGGQPYHTGTVTLVVTASGAAPRGELSGEIAGVQFDAQMEPDTVYVGQQATLDAEARFSGDLRQRMSWAPEYLPPNPSGFWIQDLADGASVRTRITRSGVTEVHAYRRAYFPLEPGDYRLPPAQLSYDLRAGLFGQNVPRQMQTDSIPLHVRDLPESGRPGSFTGAVGDYLLRATLLPASVPVGESAVLRVEVSGTGNVRALPPPRLPDLDGAVAYPPTEDARVRDSGGVVAGSKTFTWVLVPRRAGRIRIGPIEYGIFRPATGRYDVLRSGALELSATAVVAGAGGDEPPPTLGPIRDRATEPVDLDWVRSPWFAALQLLPLLAGIAVFVRRRPAAARRLSRRALSARRRREIAGLTADAHGETGDAFYRRLEQFVTAWLADRLGSRELGTGVPDRVERELRALGVPETEVERVRGLLRRIHADRFAPTDAGAAEREALVREADTALQAVDSAAPGPRRGAGSTAAMLLLAAAVAAGASPGRLVARAQDPFSQGTGAYARGDFSAAHDAFAEAIQADPRDAIAWYDYGLAAMRSGHTGEAVWAWLRALRLRPRDADARANLLAAGVDPAVVRRATPFLPLSPEEMLLLAGLLWLVGGTLLVLRFARRQGRALVIGGSAAVVAAALLAVALLLPRALSPIAIVTAPAAELRPAPDIRSGSTATLAPGEALSIAERRDDWLRVRTQDGHDGWVENRDVGSL